MSFRFRSLIASLMVLALVLTGHSMAIARGMPGASGYAEYCIGESAVMVPVDADGNPTGPAHICPDVSFSLLAGLPVIAPSVAPVSGTSETLRRDAGTFEVVIRVVARSARAPPVERVVFF